MAWTYVEDTREEHQQYQAEMATHASDYRASPGRVGRDPPVNACNNTIHARMVQALRQTKRTGVVDDVFSSEGEKRRTTSNIFVSSELVNIYARREHPIIFLQFLEVDNTGNALFWMNDFSLLNFMVLTSGK